MNYKEKVMDLFTRNKSLDVIMDNFREQFMDIYTEADEKEKKILEQCIEQMFRKYYYSPLEFGTTMTPANIVNTLIERELGKGIVVLPRLTMDKIIEEPASINFELKYFSLADHPFVKDMEYFLEAAIDGVPIDEPGIIPMDKREKFMDKLSLKDGHYLNIITYIAVEMGVIEYVPSESQSICKLSPRAKEFFNLDPREKINRIVQGAIRMCAGRMSKSCPELEDVFSEDTVKNLLNASQDTESILSPIVDKLGIDMEELKQALLQGTWDDNYEIPEEEQEKILEVYFVLVGIDIFFFTPFGYYLQLIQPIYDSMYSIRMEADIILADIDDIAQVRTKLFAAPADYDLTSLGEELLVGAKISERRQRLEKDIDDEEIYQAIVSPDYSNFLSMLLDDQDDWDDEND